MNKRKTPELLSPCGNFEKLEAAIRYGADAVYLAGKRFGMRSAADNFTPDELRRAAVLCRENGRRMYVTVNIMPRSSEYADLADYLRFLADAGAHAVIVSDIGVVTLARRVAPELEIHISTQASAVSAEACRAWAALGAKRVVLARELTLAEIAAIRRELDPAIEIECFVQGTM